LAYASCQICTRLCCKRRIGAHRFRHDPIRSSGDSEAACATGGRAGSSRRSAPIFATMTVAYPYVFIDECANGFSPDMNRARVSLCARGLKAHRRKPPGKFHNGEYRLRFHTSALTLRTNNCVHNAVSDYLDILFCSICDWYFIYTVFLRYDWRREVSPYPDLRATLPFTRALKKVGSPPPLRTFMEVCG